MGDCSCQVLAKRFFSQERSCAMTTTELNGFMDCYAYGQHWYLLAMGVTKLNRAVDVEGVGLRNLAVISWKALE